MRWVWIALLVVAIVVGAVGILWFLQGSDLVHIDPIACVGACDPVVGHHPEWQVAGGVAVLAGIAAMTVAVRRLRH